MTVLAITARRSERQMTDESVCSREVEEISLRNLDNLRYPLRPRFILFDGSVKRLFYSTNQLILLSLGLNNSMVRGVSKAQQLIVSQSGADGL